VNAKLGIVDLVAVSGYNVDTFSDLSDLTVYFGSCALMGAGYQGFPDSGFSGAAYIDHESTAKFTQEIRLSVPIGQRLEWLLGTFYTHEDIGPYTADVLAVDPLTGVSKGLLAHAPGPGKYSEYAAFTDLTVNLTDRFDVQIGARKNHNKAHAVPDKNTGPLFGGVPVSKQSAYRKLDGWYVHVLVTPRFKLSPDLMVYARLASGYRPGGYNTGFALVPPSFKPDKTQNYEIGSRVTS